MPGLEGTVNWSASVRPGSNARLEGTMNCQPQSGRALMPGLEGTVYYRHLEVQLGCPRLTSEKRIRSHLLDQIYLGSSIPSRLLADSSPVEYVYNLDILRVDSFIAAFLL
ncbi:hypothetical protein PoB_005740800 [Plakobranchus ocellatus]|uniref:Uncharacterized protein n=1 Tax=Plakobranchus ocellatus TaxID=259542 RepID=A0AAV4CH77_9GAST|nr:hypothetical protein PoB_005740800 [Plakobranchus ocellatus]